MNLYSIIIPTYNRGTHLGNTIKSVLAQTQSNFEIIIVDDGSTDNTEAIVRSLNDSRIFYYKKENGERGAARNYGTAKAKGNYVTFLDSDDELYPDFIKEADNIVESYHPKFFHIGYEIFHVSSGKRTQYKLKDSINDDLIKGNYLSCLGVFIDRQVALENPFHEDRKLSGLEDWELWLRLAAQYQLHFSNKMCARLNDHDDRSVVNFDPMKLIARHELFISLVRNNSLLVKKYGDRFGEFTSSNYSYIALHLALTKKNKPLALSYLTKSIKTSPKAIFNRRFLAILKHLIF
jgi:glycosyltransferase involved in cell wall biosynthesis